MYRTDALSDISTFVQLGAQRVRFFSLTDHVDSSGNFGAGSVNGDTASGGVAHDGIIKIVIGSAGPVRASCGRIERNRNSIGRRKARPDIVIGSSSG